jgi:DNA repair protein RecO (recombination protein O)
MRACSASESKACKSTVPVLLAFSIRRNLWRSHGGISIGNCLRRKRESSPVEKTPAILIRKTRLTETSLIIHWCTEHCGIIKTVAKGALRPKSAFAGKLDLFFDAEIEFVHSRKSDLHVLRELAVGDPRLGLRQSYVRTLAAAYFVQLLELTAERGTPIEPFHDLLRRGLNFLTANTPTRKAILHYEKEIAALLGMDGHHLAPIEAIRDLYKRVPPGRAELMEKLG